MAKRKITRKAPRIYKFSIWFLLIAIIAALVFLIGVYNSVFKPSISINDPDKVFLYIPTGSDFEDVMQLLVKKKIIENEERFRWLANKKQYPSRVKPGRYLMQDNMSNNDLVNLLRSGKQEPVDLMFPSVRSLKELAGLISSQLEPDSKSILNYLNNDTVPVLYGFNKETFPAMFIPNTYEFYWNTTPEEFVSRMKREYVAFWSGDRSDLAEDIGLSRVEVSVMASIVDQESLHNDENQTIAGVFMNRLEQGIPLQSDPTIIFALNNFSIRRVLNIHKKIDSPYNTYKNRGLPPGPISIPSVSAIDAVLNFSRHNYIFFCAKPDFSGYHNFARTLTQHNKNARLYQDALNQRKIFK